MTGSGEVAVHTTDSSTEWDRPDTVICDLKYGTPADDVSVHADMLVIFIRNH